MKANKFHSGDFNERVKAFRKVTTINPNGTRSVSYVALTDHPKRSARIEQIGAVEAFEANRQVTRKTMQLTLRWFRDLNAKDVIVHRGVLWDVQTVDNETFRQELTLATCIQSADKATATGEDIVVPGEFLHNSETPVQNAPEPGGS
jgi:SPP1 family predicted phage head-tail adaptor